MDETGHSVRKLFYAVTPLISMTKKINGVKENVCEG